MVSAAGVIWRRAEEALGAPLLLFPPLCLRPPRGRPISCGLREMWMTPKRSKMEIDESRAFRAEWTQRYLVVEPPEGEDCRALGDRLPVYLADQNNHLSL